ncbi:MAG: hypothetical protein ACTHY1_03550 [Lactobacillus helveticus]
MNTDSKKEQSEQCTIPVVVKSLPTKNKMDFGEWMKFENITEDGCGGLDYKGKQYTAYEIEKMHKAYLK